MCHRMYFLDLQRLHMFWTACLTVAWQCHWVHVFQTERVRLSVRPWHNFWHPWVQYLTMSCMENGVDFHLHIRTVLMGTLAQGGAIEYISLVPWLFKRRRRKGLIHTACAFTGVSITTGHVTVRGFCITYSFMDDKRRVYDSIWLPKFFWGSPAHVHAMCTCTRPFLLLLKALGTTLSLYVAVTGRKRTLFRF